MCREGQTVQYLFCVRYEYTYIQAATPHALLATQRLPSANMQRILGGNSHRNPEMPQFLANRAQVQDDDARPMCHGNSMRPKNPAGDGTFSISFPMGRLG